MQVRSLIGQIDGEHILSWSIVFKMGPFDAFVKHLLI